jgi:hypothetical protein
MTVDQYTSFLHRNVVGFAVLEADGVSFVSTNLCGSCSLCCKVKSISELKKPMNTWCSHCDKSQGCRIYDTPEKPPSCTAYTCLWYETQSFEDPSRRLPERFRPDHTKVVVDIPGNLENPAAIFWIDPSYPSAMRSEENQFLVRALATEHAVIEARGRKRKLLAVNESAAKKMIEDGCDMSLTEWEV